MATGTMKPARLVSVAVANKTVRIAWALLVRKEDYRVPVLHERSAQTSQRIEKFFAWEG